jgi:WhiB family redox-sensing transcriptional regulator
MSILDIGNSGRTRCVTSGRGEKGHPLTTLAYDVLWEPENGWRANAACRDLAIDVFFPVDESEEAALPAKAICATCPVADDCLQYALATNQAEGVWGGLDASERRRMRRRIRDQARRKAS